MDSLKKQFPFFKTHPTLLYLDSAATTHKPSCVIDAVCRFYGEEYGTVHRAIYKSAAQATHRYAHAREVVAQFLNAKRSEEIVFTRGTTDAINLVARSWGKTYLKPGDEIALSYLEHHSNLVPWQMAAAETGAIIRWIEAGPDGQLHWKEAIGPKTKLVAIAHMSNVTGIVHPISEIAKHAHANGALILVDGAQAASHLPVDVQLLDCDFYTFSGHKCYGPTGIGVLYGKYTLLESMPPIMGGGDMIDEVHLTHTTYAPPPIRFEAGTPIIASAIGLSCALQFLQNIDREPEKQLGQRLHEGLRAIDGVTVLGNSRGPIASFYVKGIHSFDLATLLDQESVAVRSGHLCAQMALNHFQTGSVLRASIGLYNTLNDIEQFLEILQRQLWTMKRFSS